MTNKEKYQQAFSVLKTSGDIEMEEFVMKGSKTKKFKPAKLIAAAAAIEVCFVASNSISYAATGDTWVEKMVVYFNGEAVETDVEVRDLGDGEYSYSMEVPEEGVAGIMVITSENGREPSEISYYLSDENVHVQKENGRIYICEAEVKIDITDDFSDGSAEGTIDVNGKKKYYRLTGNEWIYELEVTEEE